MKEPAEKKRIQERTDLRLGDLGSGSDYTAFIDHVGIASLNLDSASKEGTRSTIPSTTDCVVYALLG